MHTKKYRASPLTEKKNLRVSGGGKKLSGKLKIYPPPHQKSNGPSLSKKKMWGKSCFHVTQSRNLAQSPSLTLTSYEIHEIQNGVS